MASRAASAAPTARPASPPSPPGPSAAPEALRGVTAPWGRAGIAALVVLTLIATWLRVRGLAAQGFADDEVHKWLAALRYLRGDFGGDDLEHPMLMKSLVALGAAALRGHLAMEAITRLPSALAGGATVVATALLARRLFGRRAGVLAGALVALSTTAIGYHRIAKEDPVLTLFFTVSMWCLAEARAAAEDGRDAQGRRWELASAGALGAAFAAKYFFFFTPIPVLAYVWLRPSGRWRVPLVRWAVLIAVAFLVFLPLDPVILRGSTWSYMLRMAQGEHLGGDRGISESYLFMGRLYGNLGPGMSDHTPPWFFPLFALVKFTPAVALCGAAGVALALWRRAPAHRLVLVWLGIFLAFSVVAGAKYARFFAFVTPPFLALAAHAAVRLADAAGARWTVARRLAPAALAALLVAPEAAESLAHAPHHRLYVNALAGGDRRVTWWYPHCDFWDAGVREALAWIASRAEPGAEVSSEVDWTVRLYAGLAGRDDLRSTLSAPGTACSTGAPCYVIVQLGRVYRHNEAALRRLAARPPDHVVRVGPFEAAKVYRVAPGEALFPAG